MSALYQSKVAAVKTSGNLKQEIDSSNPSGKRTKAIKMAEDSQASQTDLSETHLTHDPSQSAAKRSQTPSANITQSPMRQCLLPTPPSKEAFSALYQQRQKCELKRLLKHTCPELKSLDGVVDEELADVCGSESTAVDTGYQGEVLSRRWIFENCALENIGDPNDSKTHLEREGWVATEEQKMAPPRVVQSIARPMPESSGTPFFPVECPLDQLQPHPAMTSEVISRDQTDSNVEEERMADVRSTRLMFESQKIPKHIDSHENVTAMKVVVSAEEKGAVKKQMKVFSSHTKNPGFVYGKYLENSYLKEGEKRQSGDLSSQNNLATMENISAQEETQKANVKDRAHLFESTPFHKINCREGADTTDISMSERLRSLYNFNVIHSNGTIVESLETGTAKKATYNFTIGHCPQIQTEEIITGNMKNILLQLLPRANLMSCVQFIKEDEQGNVEIRNIDVPIHQLPFTVHQDRECTTVNLVQVVEDLLSVDSSLKKGVIIQVETSHEVNQVSVFSLFSHRDLVLKGFPPQTTTEETMEISTPEEAEEEAKGDVKGTIRSLLASAQDKMASGPCRVVESERGNVKLFRKCIEKGDLEYLKSLRKTPSEEDLNSPAEEVKGPITEEDATEIVPGSVRNIKSIFSCPSDVPSPSYTHSKQTKIFHKGKVSAPNTAVKCSPDETTNKNTTDGGSNSIQSEKIPDIPAEPAVIKAGGSTTHDENQDIGKVLRGELVEAVEDDLNNLQAAILSLQQATMEAKALQHSIQEKQDARIKQESTHVLARDSFINQKSMIPSELQQLNSSYTVTPASFQVQDKYTSSPDLERVDTTEEKKGMTQDAPLLEHHTEDKETQETAEVDDMMLIKKGHIQETIRSLQSSARELQPEEEKEEIVKGNIQAALKSLGESSLNVTQSDFKAAMIYKDAGKSYKQRQKAENMEGMVKHSDELVTPPEDCNLILTASASLDQQGAILAFNKPSAAVAEETIRSLQASASEPALKEEKEEIVKGNIQAALKSLGESSLNVTQGDFKDAMIYKKARKSHKQKKKAVNTDSVVKQSYELVTPPDDSNLLPTGSAPLDQKGNILAYNESSVAVTKETTRSLPTSASEPPLEEEEIVKGNIQAALKSLGQSNLNVTQSDFKAAMIYKDTGKSHKQGKKAEIVVKQGDELVTPSFPTASAPLDHHGASLASNEPSAAVAHSDHCKTETPQCLNSKEQHSATSKKSKKKGKKAQGQKPTIPPKPDHLKAKPADTESMLSPKSTEKHNLGQDMPKTHEEPAIEKKPQGEPSQSGPISYKDALCKGMMKSPKDRVSEHQEITRTQETVPCDTTERKTSGSLETDEVVKHSETECKSTVVSSNAEEKIVSSQEAQITKSCCELVQSSSAIFQASNEFVSGFQAELQNFGSSDQNVNKSRPVKPKRMKMAKENILHPTQVSTPQQCHSIHSACLVESFPVPNDEQKRDESKVVMREKKVKKESEEERMQRLSVHRDEIMRGNVTTAMEIFDNLRKQEELKIILSKVEEIEADTSEVDVKALRRIFENVPDWVRITPKKLKPQQAKTEEKCESPIKGPEISTMELAFGDLEKASAEILNLKEQTLAKLLDIEEAIRKALLSVSTLKSESDITGLSGLFKESMGSAQASPSFSNIRKISIGSSKSQKTLGQKKQAVHVSQSPRSSEVTEVRQTPKLEIPAVKQRAGSPSSSSFISIQSGVRKESDPPSPTQQVSPTSSPQQHSVKSERFQSTKDLVVKSGRAEESIMGKKSECSYVTKALSSMDNPFDQHHFNVLEVQTVPRGIKVSGKKTIKEDYEKTDCFGNRYYSTAVTTQSETNTSSSCQTVNSPTRSEFVKYPKVNLPTFREDRPPM